jgi:hypothetical protein
MARRVLLRRYKNAASALETTGDDNENIWITEIGFPTVEEGPLDVPFANENYQRTQLIDSYMRLKRERYFGLRRPKAFIVHRLVDDPVNEPADPFGEPNLFGVVAPPTAQEPNYRLKEAYCYLAEQVDTKPTACGA